MYGMDQFILFGDSITQQAFDLQHRSPAGAALANAYVRKLDVVNRGFSGYNTDQALRVLTKIIPHPQTARVRLLTVFFGANDARLPNTSGGPQQHVPLDKYRENLKAIVTHPCVKVHENLEIILITPPPIEERRIIEKDKEQYPELGPNPPPRRTAEAAAAYAAAVRDIGNELDVTVLDLWGAMMQRAVTEAGTQAASGGIYGSKDLGPSPVLQDFLRDGLHLSGSGYDVLYNELMSLIEKKWPSLMPDKLPFYMPRWDDLDSWDEEGLELRPSL